MKSLSTSKAPSLDRTNRDIYQEVTDRIILALEKGTLPWKCPWHFRHDICLPTNACSGNAYQGINILLLWLSSFEQGFNSNIWLTFNQAQQLGGYVKRGEKSTETVIFKPLQIPMKDINGKPIRDNLGALFMENIPMIKINSLFNIAQCENLPTHLYTHTQTTEESLKTPHSLIEKKVLSLVDASLVTLKSAPQNRAYYSPLHDKIVMPLRQQFENSADFCATLLHELTHSSGHSTRLNRKGIASLGSSKLGNSVYAFEELIAEIGSAFLCAQLAIKGDVNHEGYIESWLNILRSDKKALFRAAKQARDASEFLLALKFNQPIAA